MKTYEYKGFSREGQASKGLIEALSIKEARDRLLGDGILAERISVTGRRQVLGLGDRAILYRELSSLLGAGFPLVKAFDVLIASPDMVGSNILMAGVRDRVKEGSSLADALSETSKSVTPFESAVIQSAERSATVETMLERLASFLEEQEKLRDRIMSALLYPSIVFTLGVCVAMVGLGYLIPKARDMMTAMQLPLPALTRFMIAFGSVVIKWGWLLLVAVGFTAYSFTKKLAADPDFRVEWDRRLFRFPLIGKGRTLLVNVRFARTMAVLIRGGVSLIEAVILSGRATGSPWIGRLAEGAAESVRHGSNLADAIRKIPPLSGSLPGWLQVGEASGNVDCLLDSAGQRFQSQWDRYIGMSISLLEPLLIVIIAVFALLIILSILMPIISLTQVVGK